MFNGSTPLNLLPAPVLLQMEAPRIELGSKG